MEILYIVMPAYNEEENIEAVMKQWYPILENKAEESRIVVADGGSKDKTHKILEDLRNSGYSKIEILSDTNRFHGPKVMELYQYAIRNGADYIFQTDSDGQTDPGEFEAFWALRKSYDGIFGNRTIRGDGRKRYLVQKVVCMLLKLYFGISVPDANAPFRLMKSETVRKYLPQLPEDYQLPNIMLTTYFTYYHEKVLFQEISFRPRQVGVNSMNIPRIIRIGWKALADFRMFRRNMK